jgi:hypothetical protein
LKNKSVGFNKRNLRRSRVSQERSLNSPSGEGAVRERASKQSARSARQPA